MPVVTTQALGVGRAARESHDTTTDGEPRGLMALPLSTRAPLRLAHALGLIATAVVCLGPVRAWSSSLSALPQVVQGALSPSLGAQWIEALGALHWTEAMGVIAIKIAICSLVPLPLLPLGQVLFFDLLGPRWETRPAAPAREETPAKPTPPPAPNDVEDGGRNPFGLLFTLFLAASLLLCVAIAGGWLLALALYVS